MKNLVLVVLIVAIVGSAFVAIFSYRSTNNSAESIRLSTASLSLSTARIGLNIVELQLSYADRDTLLESADKAEEYFRAFADSARKANEDEAAQKGEAIADSIRYSLRPLIDAEKFKEIDVFFGSLYSSDDYKFLMLWNENILN